MFFNYAILHHIILHLSILEYTKLFYKDPYVYGVLGAPDEASTSVEQRRWLARSIFAWDSDEGLMYSPNFGLYPLLSCLSGLNSMGPNSDMVCSVYIKSPDSRSILRAHGFDPRLVHFCGGVFVSPACALTKETPLNHIGLLTIP